MDSTGSEWMRTLLTVVMAFYRQKLVSRTAVRIIAVAGMMVCGQATAQTFQDNSNSDTKLRVATPLMAHPSNSPVVPAFSRPEAMFSDPFGMTSWLRARGIALTMDNTNEYTDAVSAPTPGHPNYRQGSSNAGQVNTALHINWEKIIGLKGFATHALFTSRYGTTANRMMGDWLAHSSEIYGGGGNVVVHLVTAYGEENLLGGRVSIAGGRLTEMSEFSASSLFCNFQNNSFCGRPKAAIDNQYITSYPAGSGVFAFVGVRPAISTYRRASISPNAGFTPTVSIGRDFISIHPISWGSLLRLNSDGNPCLAVSINCQDITRLAHS